MNDILQSPPAAPSLVIDWEREGAELVTIFESGNVAEACNVADMLWNRIRSDEDVPITRQSFLTLRTIARAWFLQEGNAKVSLVTLLLTKVAEDLGDLELIYLAYRGASAAFTTVPDIGRSLHYAAKALTVARTLNSIDMEASVWYNLSATFACMSQFDESREAAERAIELFSQSDSPDAAMEIASCYGNISYILLRQNKIALGLRAAHKATCDTTLYKSPEDYSTAASTEENFVHLLLRAGDLRKAEIHADASASYAAVTNSKKARLSADLALGVIKIYQGNVTVGLDLINRVRQEANTPFTYRSALETIASVSEMLGRTDMAVNTLSELARIEREDRKVAALLIQERDIAELTKTMEFRQSAGLSETKLATVSEALRAKRRILAAATRALENVSVTCEAIEDPSGAHIYRVGCLSALLAQQLNQSEDFVFYIELAARLHDIGKLGVRQSLFANERLLTPSESAEVKEHVTFAGDLLQNLDGDLKNITADVAKFHHENWDGSGYPERRSGDQIPLSARIVALADVFDSLTHWRPYRSAWPLWRALDEITSLSGKRFDPSITAVFVEMVRHLMSEHGDLESYLSRAAADSELIQARRALVPWSTEHL